MKFIKCAHMHMHEAPWRPGEQAMHHAPEKMHHMAAQVSTDSSAEDEVRKKSAAREGTYQCKCDAIQHPECCQQLVVTECVPIDGGIESNILIN